MRHALNSLAVVAPEWLRQHAPSDWVARYDHRAEEDRLPASKAARETLALTIGVDGYALLTTIYAASAPLWLRQVPAVQTLRQIWVQQYQPVEGAVQWRAGDSMRPVKCVNRSKRAKLRFLSVESSNRRTIPLPAAAAAPASVRRASPPRAIPR